MRPQLALVVLALLACKGKPTPATTPTAELAPAEVGKPCTVHNPRKAGDLIGLFASLEDLALAVNARGLGDKQGVSEATATAKRVADGTPCRILATERYMANTWDGRKVELTSGEHMGSVGWVQRDWALQDRSDLTPR